MSRFEPNCTMVPNAIFDYWMKRLTCNEFGLLMVIIRWSLGKNSNSVEFYTKQLEKLTGQSKRSVMKNVHSLIVKKLINRTKSKIEVVGDEVHKYELIFENAIEEGEKE